MTAARVVSVVVPARNEESNVAAAVRGILRQEAEGIAVEVVVVDDGSTDRTAEVARDAGARVLRIEPPFAGRPGAARNRGAEIARGDPVIFLDADCTPAAGWLSAILAAHDGGAHVVGGSLALQPGLSASARCDYYCGAYVIHPRRPAGWVRHHPPPNLSVRRAALDATRGFSEAPPFATCNEERIWQQELRRAGYRIYFEPGAMAYHSNRSGLINLLRRSYRWGYSSIASKADTRATRFPWLFRFPVVAVVVAIPMAFAHTTYALISWTRAGVLEPLWMLPAMICAHLAYGVGATVGGIRWLWSRRRGAEYDLRPRWW